MSITGKFLIVLAALALGWEGLAIVHPDVPYITEEVRQLPTGLVFLVGYLCGHFFWFKRH